MKGFLAESYIYDRHNLSARCVPNAVSYYLIAFVISSVSRVNQQPAQLCRIIRSETYHLLGFYAEKH